MIESLKAKAGPLPVWAWGAILGALVAVYVFFTRNSAGPVAAQVPVAPGILASMNDGAYAPANSQGVASPALIVNESEQATNFVWLANGVVFLVNDRHSALDAQRALTNYIQGEMLSPADAVMVNKVVVKFGIPPQGVDGTSVIDPAEVNATAMRAKVDQIYASVLGRDASDLEGNYWINATNGDTASITAQVVGSQEASDIRNRAAITGYYNQFLGRAPSTGEVALWLSSAQRIGLPAVAAGIQNSQEARNRG